VSFPFSASLIFNCSSISFDGRGHLGEGRVASNKKKRPQKKKRAARRQKFSTPSQTRAQWEGITAAQLRYRRAKRRQAEAEINDAPAKVEGIIIASLEKCERAWKNALRAVRRPEDLDGFD
jgi:hypothetical protein